MAKKSQIDRAVEQCEGEIAVLQSVLARLKQQQGKAPVRKPRAVAPVDKSA
jgi:hypothetical protein